MAQILQPQYNTCDGITPANALTFSIIMPCYNSESYVLNALHSIQKQQYPFWELIAVNDGSTDGTLHILNEHAGKDPRIKVFSKENGGYVSAVNYGLGQISGDYFLLLGSDDRLAENLLYELNKTAEDGAPDCIAFRTVIVQDGNILGTEHITDFSEEVSMFNTTFSEYVRTYPKHAKILSTRDTSKCYKRSLLGSLRYFGKYGFDADGIFSMLLCHNAISFSAIPVDGYFWTLRKDSLSGRKTFFEQDCDRVKIWTEFYNHLLHQPAEEITATELNYLYYFLEIMEQTWGASHPFLSQHTLTKNAVAVIRKIVKKTDYSLSISKLSSLLLSFPVLWKLFITFSGLLHSLVSKAKNR